MPSASWISSWVASMSLSIEPKCAARLRAVTQPVCGMFSPARIRWNVKFFFDCSIAATALPAEISRVAVELHQLLLRQPVEVGHRGDDPLAPQPADRLLADAVDVPDPVDERLEAARLALRVRAAVHRLALGLDDLCPAKRALLRASGTASCPRLCGRTGPTTCGITSPARWTITVSPSRMSLRLMSSSLWSVAFETVTPPTSTGSSCAHGLSAPVRPTRMRILQQFRLRGHRRPLVGARPARPAVEGAETPLLVERVDLDRRSRRSRSRARSASSPRAGRPRRRPRSTRAAPRRGSCGSRAPAATRASPSASRARRLRRRRGRTSRRRAAARR